MTHMFVYSLAPKPRQVHEHVEASEALNKAGGGLSTSCSSKSTQTNGPNPGSAISDISLAKESFSVSGSMLQGPLFQKYQSHYHDCFYTTNST